MTIYTCSKTSYITFNTINLNIYITNLSIDCIVDLFVVFIDFYIDVFINFVNDCCVISRNLSIDILIYFVKDCSIVSFNLVIDSRFDVSDSSTNFAVQFSNSFCILVDSSFVIANQCTVFDSDCTSYIDVFFVLVNTFSKTVQVTFNAVNFNIYIVDCCCIVRNICSI